MTYRCPHCGSYAMNDGVDTDGNFYSRCSACGTTFDEMETDTPEDDAYLEYLANQDNPYDIPSPREPGVLYGDVPDPDGVS